MNDEELLFLKDSEIKQAGENQKKLLAYRQKTTGRSGSFRVQNEQDLVQTLRAEIENLEMEDFSTNLNVGDVKQKAGVASQGSGDVGSLEVKEVVESSKVSAIEQLQGKEATVAQSSGKKSPRVANSWRVYGQEPVAMISESARSRIKASISKSMRESMSQAKSEVEQALGKYMQSKKPSVMKIVKQDTMGSTGSQMKSFGITASSGLMKRSFAGRSSQTARESWLLSHHQSTPNIFGRGGHTRLGSEGKPMSQTTAEEKVGGVEAPSQKRVLPSVRTQGGSMDRSSLYKKSALEIFTAGMHKAMGASGVGGISGKTGSVQNSHSRVQSLGRVGGRGYTPQSHQLQEPYLFFG